VRRCGPAVVYRQWVLSFPGPMAVRLGYDAPLLAAIAGRLARAVMQDIDRRAELLVGAAVRRRRGGVGVLAGAQSCWPVCRWTSCCAPATGTQPTPRPTARRAARCTRPNTPRAG